MTISGGRTEQLDILQVFCHVTGFTSDFHPPKTFTDICIVHDIWGGRTKHVVIGFGELAAVD